MPKTSTIVALPETGFLRLPQIIGDARADPPISGVFPVSRSTWWQGVKEGRFPEPVKLSERVTAWRVEDVRRLLDGERSFNGNDSTERRPENLKLVKGRAQFWADVRAGKRPHPRKKAARPASKRAQQ